jgi:hypothetical protein
MSSPLYCGVDGCNTHDYQVAPAFCDYQWQLRQADLARKESERSTERIIKEVSRTFRDTLLDVLDTIETSKEEKPQYRAPRESNGSARRNKRGGISL